MDIKKELINLLENVGLFIEYNNEEIDIREYGMDSLSYITFICDVEEYFGIEFPLEYLGLTETVSLDKIVDLVNALTSKKCDSIINRMDS